MKSIKVTLNSNKTFNVENLDDVRILEDENNATVIEVQFPSDYEEYSKRVDFLNIRNEKWTTSLYAPEDERNQNGQDFDRLNFRFTIPSAMAKRGELQIQFVAYLADGTDTIVPFQVLVATINKSIIYATKQGKENPELIIKAYEYSNKALSLAREALDKTANSERAALESEKSAKSAEQSASEAQTSAQNAQTSAREANTRATDAETSASEAQSSAKYAESVSNDANTKSDNAVNVSNDANNKADSAVKTSNNALTTSQNALSVANTSNTKADNAVSTSNSANTKSETAIEISNSAKQTAEQALNQVVEKMGTKVYIGNNETPESSLNFSGDPQNQLDTNKTLAESNKTRLDNHDTQLSNHSTKLTTHDSEISSTKTRLTNLENQPVITKILYDEDEDSFTFTGTSNLTDIKSTNIDATTITAQAGNFANISNLLNMKNSLEVYTATITGNNSYTGYALITTKNANKTGTSKIMIVDVYINVNVSSLVNQNSNQTCTITISGISTSEYTNINAFLECSLTQATMAVTNDYMNSHACEQVSISRSSSGLTLKVNIRRAYSEVNVYGWLHTKVLLTKN